MEINLDKYHKEQYVSGPKQVAIGWALVCPKCGKILSSAPDIKDVAVYDTCIGGKYLKKDQIALLSEEDRDKYLSLIEKDVEFELKKLGVLNKVKG